MVLSRTSRVHIVDQSLGHWCCTDADTVASAIRRKRRRRAMRGVCPSRRCGRRRRSVDGARFSLDEHWDDGACVEGERDMS